MLLRASIILAYLMMTLFSSASGFACPEMPAEMLSQSQDAASMHLHNMHPQDNMASESSMADSTPNHGTMMHSTMTASTMENCDGECIITCLACGASIQEAPALLTTAKFHSSAIQINTLDQVLAAHSARNLRPPIS